MYAIGLDIGTTSICGVVIDTDSGRVVKTRTEESNAFLATKNPWEKIQDTDKIIALAMEILESFAEYPAEVVGLTGQMHGIVYVNQDGKAISPLYTWQDERGNLPYRETTYAEYLGSFSGYGHVTDFYNKVNGLRPKEAVAYCTIMDYLGMVLCGLKRPKIHITNAAGLGCFDLSSKNFAYETELEICDGYDILGTYKGIPVSVAIGDNQAGVFSTLVDEKDLLINVGTGSQISIVSDRLIQGENIEARPYFEEKYLIVGAVLCGGRAYRILKEFYQSFLAAAGCANVDVYEIMNRLSADKAAEYLGDQGAETTSETRLIVDTRFAGTRKNSGLCGRIDGIRVDNFTPQNLTFAFLEGMMEELFSLYEQMGEHKSNLVGSGNGIRKNEVLVKIAEQKFGGKLRIPFHTEEAAYGAAMFGLVACGKFKNASEVQKLIR